MTKTLFLAAALLISSSAFAEQSCRFIHSTSLKETPNGKTVRKIPKNTKTLLLSTQTDRQGRQWGEILHGEWNKEVGFETNVEGWVLKSALRCR